MGSLSRPELPWKPSVKSRQSINCVLPASLQKVDLEPLPSDLDWLADEAGPDFGRERRGLLLLMVRLEVRSYQVSGVIFSG